MSFQPSSAYAEDVRLVLLARNGAASHFEKLLRRFDPMLRSIVRRYFIQGADKDDVYQEALIGLFKAVKDYDGVSSSLETFVRLCVNRQVITAVKTSQRYKHDPLNQSLSFDQDVGDGSDQLTLHGIIEDHVSSAHLLAEDRELLQEFSQFVRYRLSELELTVVQLSAADMSYEEIATKLSVTAKAVDNALQRARRKFKRFFTTARGNT